MYSTLRGLIQNATKQLLDTPGETLSYQFDPITLSPTEELYWHYTPSTSIAGNTFSSWSVTIAGSTAAVSQQSWLEYNVTTSGSIPEIVSTQEEFYDGEYSGSTLETLITQSNPYKSVPPSSVGVLKPGAVLIDRCYPNYSKWRCISPNCNRNYYGSRAGAEVIVTSEGGVVTKNRNHISRKWI